MKVTVRAFGPIMDLLGAERVVELPDGSTIDELAALLEQNLRSNMASKTPRLLNSGLTVLVNGQNIRALTTKTLRNGDNVVFLSPFSAG